jgi:diadenosine tetraphosphate (Ap4A) HIT family hydrolase
MAIIYETDNFIVETPKKPEIDRLEWGHIKISAKSDITDRTKLKPKQAIELMRLTIISGEAIKTAMKKIWINIWRINYQENGNRTPHLHIHLYCRATDAKVQKYGEPIIPWHKKGYQPLDTDDIKSIKKEINRLLKLSKFSDANRWI